MNTEEELGVLNEMLQLDAYLKKQPKKLHNVPFSAKYLFDNNLKPEESDRPTEHYREEFYKRNPGQYSRDTGAKPDQKMIMDSTPWAYRRNIGDTAVSADETQPEGTKLMVPGKQPLSNLY